ncbi:MAG: TIGR02757 family protein [Chitinophagales bacterium]|nr:TIGR02757 family protein [Chitinophagales bacterium]
MSVPVFSKARVFELLEKKLREYNTTAFIAADPISIPHRFSKKQDIEIAAFFAATIAWGNRKSIITSADKLMKLMDNAPHDFVLHHREKDLKPFLDFKHRTFNATDALYFIEFFRQHYLKYESLEEAFFKSDFRGQKSDLNAENAMATFHENFFSLEDSPQRTRKHVATPVRGSTCKRLNMFLRWMVRKDKSGVDFGIWKKIKPSQLLIPLDVHVDRTARKLGLIKRKQTDWQTVLELTENLKQFDPKDPVKYDFALFGLSVLDKMGIHS